MRCTIRCLSMFLITMSVLACQPASTEDPLPEAPPLSLEGLDDAVAEQMQAAQARFARAPDDVAANGELAMLLHSYRRPELAAAYYARARRLDSQDYRWAYLHARALERLGEPARTNEALRQALTLNNGYLPTQLKYAENLASLGQLEKSAGLYTKILEKYPASPQALYGLGQIRLNEGDASGTQLLERATQGKHPFGAVHYALADAYRKSGEPGKADYQLTLFEKNRSFVPPLDDPLMAEVAALNQSKHGHMSQGRELLATGKLDQAATEFEAAVTADPKEVAAHVFLIVIYGQLGQFDKAEENYRQAIALQPEHVQARVNLGVLRVKQRRVSEGIEALESALEIDPDYVDAHLKLGALREATGEPGKAVDHFRTVRGIDPANRQAGYLLARLLFKQGQYQASIDEIRTIIEPADRQTPQYLNVLANAYLGLDDHAQAQATLERALSLATSAGQDNLVSGLQENLRRLRAEQKSD